MLAGMGLQIAQGAQKTDTMTALIDAFTNPEKVAVIAGGAGLVLAKDGTAKVDAAQATK